MTAAYDDGMENLLLLFLLMTLESEPAVKERVKNLLGFYREHRELFSSLSAPKPSPEKERAAEGFKEPQKNRPREEVGSVKILEEYLKRA